MVSEFLLPFSRLNLSFLSEEKKKEVMEKAEIIVSKAIVLFESEKANKGYWDRLQHHQQVVNKALPIAEVLYPGYFLLFLFENKKNHLVYVQDALFMT